MSAFSLRFSLTQWLSVLAIALLSNGFLHIPTSYAEVFPPSTTHFDRATDRISPVYRCGCRGGGLGQVILLLPENGIATTAAAYPTLQWYTPILGENRVQFKLYQVDLATDEWQLLFVSNLRVTGESRLTRLTLPADAGLPPLEVGKTYYWSVEFTCDPESCEVDLMADGWLQRVTLDPGLQAALTHASPSEQVTLAAQNGLWLEASNTLAELVQANPTDADLQARWQELMHSVGLDMLVDQRFVLEEGN